MRAREGCGRWWGVENEWPIREGGIARRVRLWVRCNYFIHILLSDLLMTTVDDLLLKLDFRDPSPKIIDLSPEYGKVSTLTESRIECISGDKDFYLYYFLLRYPGRSLVFVSSIDGIRRLTPIMDLLQLKAFPLHSQLQQRQRLKNLDRWAPCCDPCLLNAAHLLCKVQVDPLGSSNSHRRCRPRA